MNDKKRKMLLLSLVVMLVLAAGATIAYIHMSTQSIVNSFEPKEVKCNVVESFDGAEKKEVKIENTGNIDAFIRAEIVVNWKKVNDEDSSKYDVYGEKPVLGEDYVWTLYAADSDWVEGKDGFYYYKKVVAPEETTSNLIEVCAPKAGAAPDGYFLSVEIIASAIQADGIGTAATGAEGTKDRPAEIAWTNDKVEITVNDAATTLTVNNK